MGLGVVAKRRRLARSTRAGYARNIGLRLRVTKLGVHLSGNLHRNVPIKARTGDIVRRVRGAGIEPSAHAHGHCFHVAGVPAGEPLRESRLAAPAAELAGGGGDGELVRPHMRQARLAGGGVVVGGLAAGHADDVVGHVAILDWVAPRGEDGCRRASPSIGAGVVADRVQSHALESM